MKNLALKKIQKMKQYTPPLDGRTDFNGLLLDFNERTIPAGKNVIQALENFIKKDQLQIYPEYRNLETQIAKYAKVNPNQVMIVDGSDRGIDIIFRTFINNANKVIIPSPSFAMFYQCAEIAGSKIIKPKYQEKDNFAFPLKETLEAIDVGAKLVIVCNPNNPTGTVVSLADIKKIAKKAPLVYVDEAYFEFYGISAVKLIEKYPNIIVSRSFSKAFGLAALRIGYLIADKKYISEMLKIRGPYDVNMFASVAASAALDDQKNMENYVREIMDKSKPVLENFFKKNNIKYFPSTANFILFKPKNLEAEVEKLKQKGILVRPQKSINMIRVSIGTTEQTEKFIKEYKMIIGVRSAGVSPQRTPARLKQDYFVPALESPRGDSNGALQTIATREQIKDKYAFLDRDGTLIYEPQDTFQIDSLKKLKILNGVIGGLQILKDRGYKLIMVSNQDGLGTASFPQKNFDAPHNKMMDMFVKKGIKFEKVFICPHLPKDKCDCRKPKTGLIKNFIRENKNNIDFENSFVCGDRDSDKQLAKNLGLRFVAMNTNGSFVSAIKKMDF
ncbi:MAG: histidinol-phosphate transaminase [bacterium]